MIVTAAQSGKRRNKQQMQQMISTLIEGREDQCAIAAAAWGGAAAADRISLWASIHGRDMIGTNNLELRVLEGEPFLVPVATDNRSMRCTNRPLGLLSLVRWVSLPAELCGLWFTLVGLSTDSVAFGNPASGAARARLETCGQKLSADQYADHMGAFAALCDSTVRRQAPPEWYAP